MPRAPCGGNTPEPSCSRYHSLPGCDQTEIQAPGLPLRSKGSDSVLLLSLHLCFHPTNSPTYWNSFLGPALLPSADRQEPRAGFGCLMNWTPWTPTLSFILHRRSNKHITDFWKSSVFFIHPREVCCSFIYSTTIVWTPTIYQNIALIIRATVVRKTSSDSCLHRAYSVIRKRDIYQRTPQITKKLQPPREG